MSALNISEASDVVKDVIAVIQDSDLPANAKAAVVVIAVATVCAAGLISLCAKVGTAINVKAYGAGCGFEGGINPSKP